MVYEKDKIRCLIEYKDKIISEKEKKDLEWLLEQYNNYYINSKEYEKEKKNYVLLVKKYYDLEDEKTKIIEKLNLIKSKYKTLKKTHR